MIGQIPRTVCVGDTIELKQRMMDKLYEAYDMTEEYVAAKSEERLDKLAAGWFLATWNPILGEHRDITTNFRLPSQYHVIAVNDDHIKIAIYPNFSKGYEELNDYGSKKYAVFVSELEVGYDDFYIMKLGF